jgi:propanediol dehydratase small subunit
MTEKTDPTYPLGMNARRDLKSASGRALVDIQMADVINGGISREDLCISAETLHIQAEVADQAGFDRLARNLNMAAELTRVPNDELLKMYEALRPRRSSHKELFTLAELLESVYNAPNTGRFVRQAAEIYQLRGLLKEDVD